MLSSFFLLKVSLLFMLNIHKYVEKRRVISLFYEGVYQEVTSQAKAGGGLIGLYYPLLQPDWGY